MMGKDLDWARQVVSQSLNKPGALPVIPTVIRETAEVIALLDISESLRRIADYLGSKTR
jgi:hypothetical protein